MVMNPKTIELNPAAWIAASQKRPAFVPAIGGMLVVTFPGETMRCPVESVVDQDTVFVRIDKPPISRIHTFRFDDVVGVRRRVTASGERWEAQREPEFMAEQTRLHAAAEAAKPKPPKSAAPSAKLKPTQKTASTTKRSKPK